MSVSDRDRRLVHGGYWNNESYGIGDMNIKLYFMNETFDEPSGISHNNSHFFVVAGNFHPESPAGRGQH